MMGIRTYIQGPQKEGYIGTKLKVEWEYVHERGAIGRGPIT